MLKLLNCLAGCLNYVLIEIFGLELIVISFLKELLLNVSSEKEEEETLVRCQKNQWLRMAATQVDSMRIISPAEFGNP